jgi:glycine/D-amino acid oxidase-like deaminating enzyme
VTHQQDDTANVPDQSVYGPSWYSATMVPAADRVPLTYDFDVEVCVIGGGLAGLTAAREIARRGWSVAVLETHRVAWNASGRNCGFVLPGYAVAMDQVIARVGVATQGAMVAPEAARLCAQTIRGTGMPRRAVNGWLKVSRPTRPRTHRRSGLTARCLAPRSKLGHQRVTLRTRHYFHAMHFRAPSMHPLNYALGLAAAAEQRAHLRRRRRSRSIRMAYASACHAAGAGRASHIVLACNVHLAP